MMIRNLYALLVGINDYDNRSHIPSLRGCVNDIQGMQSYLEGRVARDEFNLHLRVLANEQATRANLIEGFRAHLVRQGQMMWRYFTMRGMALKPMLQRSFGR